ncbi:sugar ABC transporter ATP-binding protein [Microbacterium sp. NPDC003461]
MNPDQGGDVLLTAKGITKAYGGVQALSDGQLTLRRGEVHAVMGENGAGKSTLMKILTGSVSADSGEVVYKGEPLTATKPQDVRAAGISIVYQEFNLLPDLSVAQNVLIGREPASRIPGFISERTLRGEVEELFERIGVTVDPSRRVGELSVAEQQMVEIAKALSTSCELLILDEPTAALTDSEIDALFRVIRDLRAQGVAIVYISHRMSELVRIVDRVTVMRDGAFVAEHLLADLGMDQLIREMVGREISNQYPPRPPTDVGEATLEVRGLSTAGLLKDISFTARRGEVLGIAGLIGAGRTELARAVFGADPRTSGEVLLDGKALSIRAPHQAIAQGIGYVTEDRKSDGLMLELGVEQNILLAGYSRFSRAGFVRNRPARRAAEELVERLNIKLASLGQEAGTLSGGNQQKVVLAKWLCTRARVLIFDEPTRGIDVGAKYEIYELIFELVRQGMTVLVISSELPEVLGITDRILVMAEGRITADLVTAETSQQEITTFAMNHMGGDQ